jgi:valyl-tRNA synthetase
MVKTHGDVISKMARVNGFEAVSDMPKGAIQIVIGDMTIGLPVADIIDLDKERERLNREIQKLEKDIKQIEGRLNNKGFVDNAPADVITENKMRVTDAKTTIEKLTSALDQLDVA